MKIRALFISDCHLGNGHNSHEKLLKLLNEVECEYLYIVGDFIDGWALNRRFRWHINYNTILQKILRMSRKGTHVVYVWGNHDDFMESFDNTSFGDRIVVVRETVHTLLGGGRYLVIHGDQFDGVVEKNRCIQYIGSMIYDFSLGINKLFRIFKFSFSNFLKQRAKEAIKYISNYEMVLSEHCKDGGYDGIICGHIHAPMNKVMGGIHYVNIGDFVESDTYVCETLEGDLILNKL